MIPTESRDIAFGPLEQQDPGNVGAAGAVATLCGTQQNHFLPLERPTPAWDNLWIDLGGEG
jgi:hypothetical protein